MDGRPWAQASFLASKSPWQPLAAVIAAGVVNLIGDLVLVCGLGKGIGGAAWATIASQATMAVALVYALLSHGKHKREEREKMRRRKRTAAGAAGAEIVGGDGEEEKVNKEAEEEEENGVELPSLDSIPNRLPGAATTMRFLRIAGPVCFLNSIKVFFVASLVQAVTAISPESSAANGVMTAIYFFFAVMGDGVSQAAQTFLPPVLGSKRATATALMLLASALVLGCCSAVLSSSVAIGAPGLFTSSPAVTAIMRECAPVMSLALLLHTASMGSEGCLLAARDMRFMTFCYVPNAVAAYLTLTVCIGGRWDMGASALWAALAQFHACRLVMNAARMFLLKERSPLRKLLEEH